jgi:hypothetical protein
MVATHFWESRTGWILNLIPNQTVGLVVEDLPSQSSIYYCVQGILILGRMRPAKCHLKSQVALSDEFLLIRKNVKWVCEGRFRGLVCAISFTNKHQLLISTFRHVPYVVCNLLGCSPAYGG